MSMILSVKKAVIVGQITADNVPITSAGRYLFIQLLIFCFIFELVYFNLILKALENLCVICYIFPLF